MLYKLKKYIPILSCLIILLSLSLNAYAYILEPDFVYVKDTYYITSSSPSSFKEAVKRAAQTWDNEVSPDILNYAGTTTNEGMGTPTNNCNEIRLFSFKKYYISDQKVAYVYRESWNSNKQAYYWHMGINSDKSFVDGFCDYYYDYQGTVTHELGHIMGLNDVYTQSDVNTNTPVQSVTMYYMGSKYVKDLYFTYNKRTLEDDDKMGVN